MIKQLLLDHSNRTSAKIILSLLLILFPSLIYAQPGPLPINNSTDYLCYYGTWDNEKLFRAKDFDLVILEPSNITANQISELKKGHDGLPGTDDDVLVIGYVSIGEDHAGNRTGDGRGPCYYDYTSQQIVYTNSGFASWYLDDADHNNLPDENANWGSFYVNAGDSLWRDFVKNNPAGTDNTLVTKNCDGLFLDTIDTASPWYPWPYRWMVVQMSEMIAWLRETYPDKYLIANRGLFYFDPDLPTAYANSIRPYIDGDMFESYYPTTDRTIWAQKVNNEANKPDGFKVIALDYFNPSQINQINQQISEVFSYNWGDYISQSSLDVIRYDVFHKHLIDQNPPTWNTSIGISSAVPDQNSVTLKWHQLTDQSLPLNFNIYYTTTSQFNINTAVKLNYVQAVYDSASATYSYQVTGLTNYTKYYFVVRAEDAVGNEDKNLQIISATPPDGTSNHINIDGSFDDWNSIPFLDQPPNPVESTGDVSFPEADIRDIWAANDSLKFFLSYDLNGNFSSSYFYHIFFDTDNNPATGYRYQDSSSVGAELMIENNSLWKYTGSGGTNWNWAAETGLSKSNSGGRTELSLPLILFPEYSTNSTLRLIIQNNLSASPYTMIDVAPDNFGSQYFQYIFQGPDNIKNETETSLSGFTLYQNFPNPFNPATRIKWYSSKPGWNTLKVYNSLGQEVANLINEFKPAGIYEIEFGRDNSEKNLSSGVYFYQLKVDESVFTRKMILIK